MKLVVLDGYALNPGDISWEPVKRFGDLTVYDRTPECEIIPRIGEATIVFTNKVRITEEIFKACPGMKYICVLATGYNVVDTGAASRAGVVVSNIPTYGTEAVAQHVFALLLEICNHVGVHDASVKNGDWTASSDFCYWKHPLTELAGKTMGIVGYGRIGRAVAGIARALGMNVVAYDMRPFSGEAGVRCVSLVELYAEADVISMHCPLSPETDGMINSESVSRMKDGVILINTARGALVKEEDLARALGSGKVAYAALDVVREEPIPASSPLLSAKNCIITPHIAWAPRETRARLLDIAAENTAAFLKGSPMNVVN